jgi:hypothetical protein
MMMAGTPTLTPMQKAYNKMKANPSTTGTVMVIIVVAIVAIVKQMHPGPFMAVRNSVGGRKFYY